VGASSGLERQWQHATLQPDLLAKRALVAWTLRRTGGLVVDRRPGLVWYPAAIYPYPDPFTPAAMAIGFWYWSDAYQQYFPYVGACPSGWRRRNRRKAATI
jgi:hypothetical protein